MLRAVIRRDLLIVAMALCAASAHAQSSSWLPPFLGSAPDAACRPDDAYRLAAMDKAVCSDRALVDKHHRLGLIQQSLQKVAGFPRTLRLEQMHRTWLDDRVQCTGPDVTACLHRLYDARIKEITDAIASEKQAGRRQP